MWERITEKLALLRALDRQFQAFGADWHRYEIQARLLEAELVEIESKWRLTIPSQLRQFYLHIGNGGAGPDYGLLSAQDVSVVDGRLFLISHQGCGYETYIVADTNCVVFIDDDGEIHESGQTLMAFYEAWLDKEIHDFQRVSEMISTDLSMQDIDNKVRSFLQRNDAHDLVMSIINVEKPVALFGSRGHRIYHHATQLPWYEKQLANFRSPSQTGHNPLETRSSQSSNQDITNKRWWAFWR